MAYGTVKVDNIIFDKGGSDQNVTVSGIYNALTSGITVTGTISGPVVIGSTSVSGATVAGVIVSGTTVQGASGSFISLTGTTTAGTTASFVTGTFTSLTGTTTTGVTAGFTTGTFTSLTGTTTTGTTASFATGAFTSLTGVATIGTTASFATGTFTSLTGTTTTGTTANFTTGNFQNLSGNTITGNTITGNTINALSGVFQNLSAVNQTFSGNLTFSGNTATLGNATISSGLTVTGTISGTTITGTTVLVTTGSFTSLTGTTTTGVTARFTTGTFTSLTGTTTTGVNAIYTTGSFTSLTGTTTTGTTARFTTGTFTSLTGTTTTGTTATFTTGNFQTLSGNTITGNTINALSGVFQNLSAVNQTFSGSLTFSGNTATLGNATISSGLKVTGTISGTTITGTTVMVTTGSFTSLTGTTTTGVTARFTTGTFTSLTGTTTTGTTSTFTTGNFQTVSGVTIIGSTTVSGATVTGTTANFTSGNFSNLISAAATLSGALIMANQQQVRFREAVGNGINHIALQAPAIVSADRTITLPDQTGTVVTTGDNGSVTSTMILDGTILNADINASAGIVDTKLATIATAGKVSNSATTATSANTANAIVARDASGNFTAGTISAALGTATTPSIAFTGDLNTGIYSPGADQFAISTGGVERVEFGGTEVVFNDGGADVDFRVEGDTRPNLFKIDAGLDQVQVENLNGGPLAGFRNLLINGNPFINQRSYVSGAATTGANQYTLDRWRVVTTGQNISFTESANVRTVTAPAGGCEQVIEGINIFSGTHTLNWTGTATATVNGSAVAKGGNVTLTGGTDATVRFINGTFSLAQLEPGTVATPFERRARGIERVLCQRYYEEVDAEFKFDGDLGGSDVSVGHTWFCLVEKRPTPTVSVKSEISVKANNITSVTAKDTNAAFCVWEYTDGNSVVTRTKSAIISFSSEL